MNIINSTLIKNISFNGIDLYLNYVNRVFLLAILNFVRITYLIFLTTTNIISFLFILINYMLFNVLKII